MTKRYKIQVPLILGCEPRTLLDPPCPEPGCWGCEGHRGLHAAPGARWSTKGRP